MLWSVIYSFYIFDKGQGYIRVLLGNRDIVWCYIGFYIDIQGIYFYLEINKLQVKIKVYISQIIFKGKWSIYYMYVQYQIVRV